MEFRDGEDYARFTAAGVEWKDGEKADVFMGTGLLLGWALDQGGRVCVLYRKLNGFVPPSQPKLLRFLNEEETELERSGLNILAKVD
jgi:hypothetical protein